MKILKTSDGIEAVVDDEDFEFLSKFRWRLNSSKKPYFVTEINGQRVMLHRMLMNPKKGFQVDHINENKNDNRRKNLRICTNSENQCNRGKRKNNRSGFKGVYWIRDSKKWAVAVYRHGKQHFGGCYKSKIEAAKAANELMKKHHGEFARLNVIPII